MARSWIASPVESNVVISWTTDQANFNLESATNLISPAVWTPVTNTPTIDGNQRSVTVPIGTKAQFFRLRKPLP